MLIEQLIDLEKVTTENLKFRTYLRDRVMDCWSVTHCSRRMFTKEDCSKNLQIENRSSSVTVSGPVAQATLASAINLQPFVSRTAAKPATVMVGSEWLYSSDQARRTVTVTSASDSATVTRRSCSLAPLPVTVSGTEQPRPGPRSRRRPPRLAVTTWRQSRCRQFQSLIRGDHSKRLMVHAYRHGWHH